MHISTQLIVLSLHLSITFYIHVEKYVNIYLFHITFYINFFTSYSFKVRTAEAVIILSDKCSQTPVEDDWKNLMCVVSIKNLYPNIRIICELMLIESKVCLSL